jgi:hypothetical protein
MFGALEKAVGKGGSAHACIYVKNLNFEDYVHAQASQMLRGE